MNIIEARVARGSNIFHSTSFTLFGVMGILGAIMASMNNAIIHGFSFDFVYQVSTDANNHLFLDDSWWEFLMGLMAAAIALVFGIVAGIFVMCFAAHER